jgi:hypothetical protein
MLCKVCNKKFKRLTASHLKTHGLTYEEYLKEYEGEAYQKKQQQKAIIDFFNEFYITVRYKFLKYLPSREGKPITVDVYKNKEINKEEGTKRREYPLSDSDLQAHLEGKETIGIFFPSGYTKLIGLDIDKPDKDLLYRLVMLLQSYGLDEKNMLISSSGGKGYHVDIFLANLLPRLVVDNFHKVLLDALNVDKTVIELRGGTSEAGYKLPLGVHFKTGCFCDICDAKGNRVQDPLEVLKTREKANINIITTAAKSFYVPIMTDEEHHEKEELISSVKLLPQYTNTAETKIESIKKLLKNGIHEKGNRNNSVFNVALYLKDQGYCLAEAKKEIFDWIGNKWSKSVVDDEVLRQAKTTIESVYKNDKPFLAGAREITISDTEIREILSIKTNNKLQTKSLRRLYYVLAIHSKAYADKKGVFYMTYEQMAQAGLNADRRDLKKQLEKLAEMGKLIIVRSGEKQERGYKKLPNKYFLPAFKQNTVQESKTFKICHLEEKCSDCLERAFCHLLPARERAQYLKGKEFKQLQKCPYNE